MKCLEQCLALLAVPAIVIIIAAAVFQPLTSDNPSKPGLLEGNRAAPMGSTGSLDEPLRRGGGSHPTSSLFTWLFVRT